MNEGISVEIAWRSIYKEKSLTFEGNPSDAQSKCSYISRDRWCDLTKSDPTPYSHTSVVIGCTHCEYNNNQDISTSCTHNTHNPNCEYCQSRV